MDLIAFKWWRCRGGFRLERKRDNFTLTSIGDQFDECEPLQIPNLFAKFADADASPEGARGFCNKYGALGGGRPDLAPGGKPTKVGFLGRDFLARQWELRTAVALFNAGDRSKLTGYWNRLDGAALVRANLREGP
jgi:hypothetical protein